MSQSEITGIYDILNLLFENLPPGFTFFKYVILTFCIIYAFVFVIDFFKIVLSKIFRGN